ncbi:MAG TPA: DUF3179 domain-containing (seleno)protein [Vicinamibacteria bacterium]|nr:DUF3179 domain-containing (seleno)protein [Vicinamibacteria bacterium]
MRSYTAVSIPLLLLAAAGSAAAQERTNRDQSGNTELHEPGFPVKSGLTIVPAAQAALRDDDLVLGIVVGGEARAYPINLMWEPQNEVLNDTLGGEPIAATWCPIAHSGVVYDRSLDRRTLELGAVGLEKGVFILYDRQTGTHWSQVSGQATRGASAGRSLRKKTSTITTWGRWRRLQPDTSVYSDPGLPSRRRFTEESIARITQSGSGPVVNEDLVAGIEGRRTPRAYLLRKLAGPRVVNDELDGEPVVVFLAEDAVTVSALRRRVAGRTLTFAAEGDSIRDTETGTLWDPMTGRAASGPLAGRTLEGLTVTTALWYAWRSQRPRTSLWEGP